MNIKKAVRKPKDPNLRVIHIEVPKYIWCFLKTTAVMDDVSMSSIVVESLTRYKKKVEGKSEVM